MWTLNAEHLSWPLGLTLLVIVVAAIVHDDVACVTVGLFIASDRLPAMPAIAACTVGTFLGDLAWFLTGWIGQNLLARTLPLETWIGIDRWRQAQRLYDRFSVWAIVLTRFLPGLRTPFQLLAGGLCRRLVHSSLCFLLAAVIYAPLLIGIVAMLGHRLNVGWITERWGPVSLVLLAATFWIVIRRIDYAWTPHVAGDDKEAMDAQSKSNDRETGESTDHN